MTDKFIKDDGRMPNHKCCSKNDQPLATLEAASVVDDLNDKKVQDFLDRLKKHQDHYRELKEEIKECEYIINLTKKMIYNICDHKWTIDHTISDEHTMYVCNKCNSNR
jgi:hypothetical protein